MPAEHVTTFTSVDAKSWTKLCSRPSRPSYKTSKSIILIQAKNTYTHTSYCSNLCKQNETNKYVRISKYVWGSKCDVFQNTTVAETWPKCEKPYIKYFQIGQLILHMRFKYSAPPLQGFRNIVTPLSRVRKCNMVLNVYLVFYKEWGEWILRGCRWQKYCWSTIYDANLVLYQYYIITGMEYKWMALTHCI